MGRFFGRLTAASAALSLVLATGCGNAARSAADNDDPAGGKADDVSESADVVFMAVPREQLESGTLTIDGQPVMIVEHPEELFLDMTPVGLQPGEDTPQFENRIAFAIPLIPVALMALSGLVVVAVGAQHVSNQAQGLGRVDWSLGSSDVTWNEREDVDFPDFDVEDQAQGRRDASLAQFMTAAADDSEETELLGEGGEELFTTVLLPALASRSATEADTAEDEHPCGEQAETWMMNKDQGLRRPPYLQRVTQSEATIMWAWNQSTDEVGSVRYAGLDGEWHEVEVEGEVFTTDRTDLKNDFIQYEARLEWLIPASAYCYEVYVGDRKVAGNMLLRTGANVPRPMRLLALGDSGTDSNKYQYPLRDVFVRQDADVFLHVGDLAYDPDVEKKPATYRFLDKAFFRAYADLLTRVPAYPALGNHEQDIVLAEPYLSSFSFPQLCDAFPVGLTSECETLEEAVRGEDRGRYYSFDQGNAHFVSLDTNDYMLVDDPLRRAAMLAWLEADLSTNRATWTIVFMHHPPYVNAREDYGGMQTVREHIVPILQDHDVDLVLVGDSHLYERTEPILQESLDSARVSEFDGIPYLVVGSGGREPSGNEEPSEFTAFHALQNAFVRMYILGCHGYGEAVNADNTVIDAFTINACQ